MMLKACPKSRLSWAYTLVEGDTAVAEIVPSWWRESGELVVRGVAYRAYRQGLFSGPFVLASGSSVLASADKPSALHRSYVVEFEGKKFLLGAESAFRRKFVLSGEDGGRLGTVEPEHALTRKAVLKLPEGLPLEVSAFMFWLVMVLWKRDSDSAAAS